MMKSLIDKQMELILHRRLSVKYYLNLSSQWREWIYKNENDFQHKKVGNTNVLIV
jgi:hypothetical protein